MKIHRLPRLWALLLTLALLAGCAGAGRGGELNIAEQFGLAYAPLQIMRQQGLLEKRLPGVQINWKQFGGPTAIREGMLAGEIDIGFMGPAPVLMGLDNGMPWRFATGISANEMAIVTNKPQVRSLRDFGPEDRIAVLSPACTQHVLLSLAAEQELGDAAYFDSRIVPLSHPDAMNALLAGTEVAAHVATPPYIQMELEAGMHVVRTGEDIMGMPFTFITGVATERFHDARPGDYAAFLAALGEAIGFINNNLDEAVRILSPVYGVEEGALRAQMTVHGTIYSTRLQGMEELSAAMQRMGFTKGNPAFAEMVFENVLRQEEGEN